MDETVRFVESYKHRVIYENERVKVTCYDHRYTFEPEELLSDLEICDSFKLEIKEAE